MPKVATECRDTKNDELKTSLDLLVSCPLNYREFVWSLGSFQALVTKMQLGLFSKICFNLSYSQCVIDNTHATKTHD